MVTRLHAAHLLLTACVQLRRARKTVKTYEMLAVLNENSKDAKADKDRAEKDAQVTTAHGAAWHGMCRARDPGSSPHARLRTLLRSMRGVLEEAAR